MKKLERHQMFLSTGLVVWIVVLLGTMAWEASTVGINTAEASVDPHSQRTLQALQDTAKAQARQAKALEDIYRKLDSLECHDRCRESDRNVNR